MMSRTLAIALCAVVVVLGASMASADHVQCARDLNNDGKVDSKDIQIIEDAMGARVGVGPYDERADLDEDEAVTAEDLAAYAHCQ
jgi:hypothetical protein